MCFSVCKYECASGYPLPSLNLTSAFMFWLYAWRYQSEIANNIFCFSLCLVRRFILLYLFFSLSLFIRSICVKPTLPFAQYHFVFPHKHTHIHIGIGVCSGSLLFNANGYIERVRACGVVEYDGRKCARGRRTALFLFCILFSGCVELCSLLVSYW